MTLDRASGRTVRRIATTPSNKNNAAPKSASPHQAYAGEGTMAPQPGTARQQSATWAEKWFLQWTPESEIELVEAVLLGETVELATAYKFKSLLESCTSIADAAALVHDACQCGLMKSMELARRRLQELAATSSEFAALASAAWWLSLVVRYGDVRRFDAEPLVPLVEALFVQAALSLFAAANCDDRAVKAMMQAIDELNKVGLEFHDRVEEPLWIEQLRKLSDADDRNPSPVSAARRTAFPTCWPQCSRATTCSNLRRRSG